MTDNGFMTQIIGIIVAIIVASAVLIPIIQSINDGGGDNGGGSEFDGEIVNDLQSLYEEIGVSIPFKTYQKYCSTEMLDYERISKDISDLDLTLDMDFIDALDGVRNVEGYGISQNIYLLNFTANNSTEEFNLSIYLSHSYNNPYSNMLMFNLYWDHDIWSSDDSSIQFYGFVSDITSFGFTVKEGVVTVSVEGTTTDGDPLDITESYDSEWMQSLEYVSDEDIGWVGGWPMADNIGEGDGVAYPDLVDGCVFNVYLSMDYTISGEGGYADNNAVIEVKDVTEDMLVGTVNVYSVVRDYGYDADKYFIVQYEIPLEEVRDGTYKFVDTGGSSTWTVIGNVGLEDAEDVSSLGTVWIWGDYGLYASSVNANPADIDNGGQGNGGQGNGVVSALLAVIPVFVILGILMGSMVLFYQNRQTI